MTTRRNLFTRREDSRRRAVRGLLLLTALMIPPQPDPATAGPGFQMADALVCTIETSTQPDDIGKKISLSGLTTEAPKAVFENHIRSSMVKLFESDAALVIQLVAAVSGSVDTIVIDTRSGRFAHTAAGAFPAEIHAVAETGTCRPE
jgi:hypothetical protein